MVRSRPTEAEARLPYAALNDLLGELLDELHAELPDPQRAALDVALLRAEAVDTSEPLAISLGVLNLLRAATARAPVIVGIDDAPWLDGSSCLALEFALRRLGSEPIGLVAAVRTSDGDLVVHPLASALEHRALALLEIAGLTPTGVDALLERHLGLRASPSAVARICRISGGNPFYALELARSMRRRGMAARDEQVVLPESLAVLISGRLARLSPAAVTLTIHAAALSQPARPTLDAALGPEVVRAGLAETGAAQVLEEDGEVLRFAHPLLAAEAYSRAAPEQRREAHRRLAAVVAEPEEHARHLALAATGPDAEVAGALDRAALRARQCGAPDAAADLSERAAELTPADQNGLARGRIITAARHLLASGDTGRARRLLDHALARAPAGLPRAEVLAALAEVRMLMDDWAATDQLASKALRDATDDPRLQVRIRLLLAGVGFITGRHWKASAQHAADAMELAEALGDPETLAETIGHYATWQYVTGRGLRRDLMHRAAALEPWTGQMRVNDHPDVDFAHQLLEEGDRPGFRERVERLVARAERAGDYSSLALLLGNLAEADFRDGRAADALARIGRGERIARSIDQSTALAHLLTWHAGLLARLGAEAEARQTAEAALELISQTGWRSGEYLLRSELGVMELSLGNAAAAHDIFDSLIEGLPERDHDPEWQRQAIPPDVEALVTLGRLKEARARLDPYEKRARSLGRRPAVADGLRSRGLLLGAERDLDGATEALERADAIYAQLDDPWNRARNLLILGGVHRRARHRGKAREALIASANLFDRLSARLWAERARSELGRGASRRGGGADGLTETQRQVAALVSAGHTNRQVADALFMSVHTVEAHLTAIYRALGISSRVELTRNFRDSARTIQDSAGQTPSEV